MGRRRRGWAALLVVVSGLTASGCGWTQLGFDAGHTGLNPTEHTITPGNVGSLTVRWRGIGDQPVVGGPTVFSRSYPNLLAQDSVTGTLRWKQSPASDENAGFGPPVVSGDTVYAAGNHVVFPPDVYARLHAFDAATGTERWSVPLAGCTPLFNALTVSDGFVIMADTGVVNKICAVDTKTRTVAWSVTVPGLNNGGLQGVVAAAGGRVFAYGWRGFTADPVILYALDERTGAFVWFRTASGVPFQGGSPVVAGNRLFIPAGTLSTFDAATGAPGWTVNGMKVTDVAVTGNSVVTTGQEAIASLNLSTGAVLWSIAGPSQRYYSKPAIANGMVFVTSYVITGGDSVSVVICCARLSAIDLASGGELSSIPTQATNHEDARADYPIVSGGTVYVAGLSSGGAFRSAGS